MKRFSCSSSFYVSFSFFNNADIRKRWRIKVKINHSLINSKIVRDRYTIKAALAIVISIATSESVWNCVTCSPLVRLCVTIRLFRHSFSRGQRLIVQRSLGISCVREAAERCSLAERGLSFSFILPLSLSFSSNSPSRRWKLSCEGNEGERGRGATSKVATNRKDWLEWIIPCSTDVRRHSRAGNSTCCCPSPLCFVILRNREAGAEWDIGDTFLASMESIANRFLKFRILSFLGKFIPVTNFFEFSKNNEYNI